MSKGILLPKVTTTTTQSLRSPTVAMRASATVACNEGLGHYLSISLSMKASDTSAPSQNLIPHAYRKAFGAAFYGLSSILVIFTNKAVMTSFRFPYVDFLATVQFVVTTLILLVLIWLRKIDVPMLNWQITFEILPIAVMFLGNVICGLGSTNALSIPMFTALRRFSILMIMFCEWCLLSIKPSSPVLVSIGLMILGTIIAAASDLSYDATGYFMVTLNNVFTALNGVYMKKAAIGGKVSKMGVLFYNSMFSAILMIMYFIGEYMMKEGHVDSNTNTLLLRGSAEIISPTATLPPATAVSNVSTLRLVYMYAGWQDVNFLTMFVLAALMGCILNYAIFLCTTWNSPLTTAVVGVTKNIAATYIGMVAFPDYTFSWWNFAGINLSIAGSLYYSYVTIIKGNAGYGSG